MASTQDPSMGAMIDPSQNTLNDLQSGDSNFAKGADQSTQTAIGLATMQDQVKQKQMQTEKMADELDQAKFSKLIGGITAITRADPKYRGAIADQVFKGFDRNGIAADPVWRDALVKDDSTLLQMRQAIPILMNRKSDPAARGQAFQTFANYIDPTGAGDGHDKLQGLIGEEQKRQTTEEHDQAGIKEAQIRADAMMNGGAAVTRSDRLTNTVANDFDKAVEKYKTAQDTVGRGYHTLDNPPQGIVTNQMVKEVSNEIANSLAQGMSSAEDRKSMEYSNIATALADITSKVGSKPEGVAAPELVQYLKATLKRIDQSYSLAINRRTQENAAGKQFKSPGANDAVQAKLQQYSNRRTIDDAGAGAGAGGAPIAGVPQDYVNLGRQNNISDAVIQQKWQARQKKQVGQ